MAKSNLGISFEKLNSKGEFKINEVSTIKNFKLISKKVVYKMRWGEPSPYLEFKGKLGRKNVEGLVNLDDEAIYFGK
ncbi:hypothetical protein DRQ25_12430 [Candidatus Fermentibacteria bacterium]|nr:MAG: hypothetical protein DRQ25_12430 [Candidatus Fermentibacteria bacterium]